MHTFTSQSTQVPEVSTLPGAGKGIPVPCFSFWAKYGPNVIYKARNLGKEIGDKLWHSSPPLYRRLAEQGIYEGGGSTNYAFPPSTHSVVRLDYQSAKVRTHTLSEVSVPVLQFRSFHRHGVSYRNQVSEY
jgi:hypothetical protein